MNLPRAEALKLPYLRRDFGNRIIPLLPYIDDNGKTHLWLNQGDKLIYMKDTELIESDYFAKEKYSEKDFYSWFLDTIYQRLTGFGDSNTITAIREDLHNLSCIFKKLKLFFQVRKDLDIQRFIVMEIEYIFYSCRSLFDLLQFFIRNIWDNVSVKNPKYSKNQLPSSFAKMTLTGDSIVKSKVLIEKYGIPKGLADFYYSTAPFFQTLRKYRRDYIHYGYTPRKVFSVPKGFAINMQDHPFSAFKEVWNDDMLIPPNNLAPLKPFIALIVNETIKSLDEFVKTFENEVILPEKIAPGYKLYMRGTNIEYLNRLNDMMFEDIWFS